MRRRDFLASTLAASVAAAARPLGFGRAPQAGATRRILIAGGGLGYFEDNDVKRVVASRAGAKVYHVSVVNGKVAERVFEPEMIS